MTTALKVTEVTSSITNDELMLKELERRDGIYSFIFHELETPKVPYNNDENTTLPIAVTSSSALTSISEQPEDSEQPSMSTQESQQLPPIPIINSTTTSSILPLPLPPPPPPPSWCMTTTTATAAAGATATATASFGTYHSCAPSFVTYNCRFRVCVASPPFSHISTPLVRHRQHTLKDAVDYTSCAVVKTPDIRALFPLDPDVHAPFAVATKNSTLDSMTNV